MKKEKKDLCIVCGATAQRGERLCEVCRESLSLCDVEHYLLKKTASKNCTLRGANAFK